MIYRNFNRLFKKRRVMVLLLYTYDVSSDIFLFLCAVLLSYHFIIRNFYNEIIIDN